LTIPAVLLVPKENILPALFTMWPRMYIINLIGIAFAVSLISRESARIRLIEGLNNSNSLTTDVLDSIPAQVVILDQQGVIRRENRTWLEKATTVMNNPEKTFVDQNYLSVCFDAHDASGNPLIEAVHIGKGIQAVLNGQQNQFDAQYSMTHANKTQWYQLSAVRLHRSTETHRCAVLHFEISELVQSYQHLQTLKLNLENLVKERTLKLEEEVALREAAEIELRTYENAFKRSIEPMLITDDEFRILDVNPAYATLVESPQETLMNQLPSVLKLPQNGIDRVQVKRELEQNQYWQGQLNEVTPSGQTMSVIVSIAPILESDKTRYFITYFNITDRVKKEGVISKLAYQDALTGLNNRIALEQKIQTILSSAHRNKTMCAVIFIDLDDFKPVNDCYGHHIGDELLQMLASRLNDSIRENDIACRLGGDEFVLVLTEIEELDAIRKYVDQLSHELNTPYPVADYQITVTASIGVAVYPHHGREFSSLLSIADHAMYRSKALKNNYYIEPFPE
jgi:diguanylate cyclase (GGDEF)-like protein/PAS domain S-box-containing protein